MYILPSDINLSMRSATVGYNNEILMSDSRFSLGRNDTVHTSVPEKISHKKPISLKHAHKEVSSKHTSIREAELTREEERITLMLTLASTFRKWYAFH